MVETFDQEAWRNLVYPLDNRTMSQKQNEPGRPQGAGAQGPRRFEPGGQTVHRAVVAAMLIDRHFRIDTRIDQGSADEGVLWAIGDVQSGMVLSVEPIGGSCGATSCRTLPRP